MYHFENSRGWFCRAAGWLVHNAVLPFGGVLFGPKCRIGPRFRGTDTSRYHHAPGGDVRVGNLGLQVRVGT